MRSVGIHQGLAPVLDVARDMRWGRTEETIGEDPYLVGSIGTAYVRGLQSAGIQATVKHFAGDSASRTGRNMAPVSMGPREFADVMLVPFEMALRLGGARSVMPSYTDVDGVPVSADRSLLTGLLRDELGFDGVVVSDYFAISFLQTQHGVAGTLAQAAALALDAGLDVELPSVRCYGPELPGATISYSRGCDVRGEDRSDFAQAAAHAWGADMVVAVLGDQAGLFGRGTSGEGCDAADLRLPGVQEDLLRVLVAAGKPVVLVLVTGRPYALGPLAGQLAGSWTRPW